MTNDRASSVSCRAFQHYLVLAFQIRLYFLGMLKVTLEQQCCALQRALELSILRIRDQH